MSTGERRRAYLAQTGRRDLTARQQRRLVKKDTRDCVAQELRTVPE